MRYEIDTVQAIGVDDDVLPCGTVLEAAKDQGFRTGLVVTSRITHVWFPRSKVGCVDSNLGFRLGYSGVICCTCLGQR